VVTDAEWKWHVWYPLRRKGEFNAMPQEEQMTILREHGKIGHGFGDAGLAHDIRLACFGIDQYDNDFVIGLIGKELFPLSACVQAMRKRSRRAPHAGDGAVLRRQGRLAEDRFLKEPAWPQAQTTGHPILDKADHPESLLVKTASGTASPSRVEERCSITVDSAPSTPSTIST